MVTKNKLKQCTIMLTRGCNLRCEFCHVKDAGYAIRDQISFEDLKRIVDFCCEAKVQFIFFSGGEPVTYARLADILQYIRLQKHYMSTALATNGVPLKNLELCRKLVNSGLDYLDISLKGKDSSEWVKVTGVDCFAAQQQAIRNLSGLSFNFTCSMVISLDSVYSFCEAVKIAHDNGAKSFSFTFIIDNEESHDKDLMYLQKHNPFKLIDTFISQLDKLNAITDDWWIEYSFPLCIFTKEQLRLLQGRLASPCQIRRDNAVTFNTKMELLPCDMFFRQPLGRFGRDFSNIYEFKALKLSPFYQSVMSPITELPSEQCNCCDMLEQCYGGCPVLWKHYSFKSLQQFKAAQINSSCVDHSDSLQ